jgi:hypothetical protein
MTLHTFPDLAPLHNARAATTDLERRVGGVNAWGNSFPAEELPFGGVLHAGGVPFIIGPWRGGSDHVEALGQTLPLSNVSPCTGLAILCFGEMGDQDLLLEVVCADGRRFDLQALAWGWLVQRGHPVPPDGFACSHLHYPGGYELDHLRPVLWCNSFRWDDLLSPVRLRLGTNPLFHLMGVTCLHGTAPAENGHDAPGR